LIRTTKLQVVLTNEVLGYEPYALLHVLQTPNLKVRNAEILSGEREISSCLL
jgi:hypothetical protein